MQAPRAAPHRHDEIVQAEIESARTPAGYRKVNVRDIESGKVRAARELFGAD